jgi:hypothetical protein
VKPNEGLLPTTMQTLGRVLGPGPFSTLPVTTVYVDLPDHGYVHCSARIDEDGDLIITPWAVS